MRREDDRPQHGEAPAAVTTVEDPCQRGSAQRALATVTMTAFLLHVPNLLPITRVTWWSREVVNGMLVQKIKTQSENNLKNSSPGSNVPKYLSPAIPPRVLLFSVLFPSCLTGKNIFLK